VGPCLLTNAHTPPFQTQKKMRGYNAHMTHKCPRMVMATWPPGHQPASEQVVWTLPTLPPTKVLTAHGRWPMATPAGRPARWPPAAWPPGSLAAGRRPHGRPARWPPAARASPMGTRAGPAANGHGSGGATNKIFYSPHCPHDPQIFKFIFGIFGTCLKAYLLHRARSKRLRRA
jgi:hypothetical protein